MHTNLAPELIARRVGELRLERITGKLQRDALLELEQLYTCIQETKPSTDALIGFLVSVINQDDWDAEVDIYDYESWLRVRARELYDEYA